jgi:hypothetical protein
MKDIKLGYEVDSGKQVDIKPTHLVVSGITQESGKTTTLQALIKRGGFRAVIFKTKPGERGIIEGTVIPPYYRDDFTWEYASELMESVMKEKLKFERSWIIRYSKGARSLLEFKACIDKALADDASGTKKMRELDKSVLITLQAYLEKILPELQYAPFSKTLELHEGINIMDLEGRFKDETQAMVIRSVINEVLKNHKNTVVVIPEAWKFMPEGIGNPVKRAAGSFIRQGAANGNLLWIDSQDITGVDKAILKQVSTWVLGYQREINEIKRTLDQIPLAKRMKPKPEDIASLQVGHFFVATSQFTKKVYVQPVWLNDKTAVKVAMGKIDMEDIQAPDMPLEKQKWEAHDIEYPDKVLDLEPIKKELVEMRHDFFDKVQELNQAVSKIYSDMYAMRPKEANIDEIVSKVLQKVATNSYSSVHAPVDEETIIAKVLARVPKSVGGATYEVAPLEKLKRAFMEEAKQKVLVDVSKLDDEQKKMLKYIEVQGSGQKLGTIIEKCLFKLQTSGGTRDSIGKKLKDMAALELIRYDSTHGLYYPALKDMIAKYCGQHGATPQEIDQVYSHIVMEMLK